MAIFGHFPEKGLEIRDFPDPGRGFYINPSRRGPAVPRGWSRDATERSPSRPPRPLSVSYWERCTW